MTLINESAPEVTTTTSIEPTTPATPEPAPAPAAAEKEPTPSDAPTEEPKEGEEPAPAAYIPPAKLKALDEEHEIPEMFRGLMKDEKSEKEVTQFLNKMLGFDHVAKKRDEFKTNFETERAQRTEILNTVQELRDIYSKGDIDLWLERLAVPKERMLQWALEQVKYSQLPPEQQREIDDRREAQRRSWQAEQHAGGTERRLLEVQHQTKMMLLEAGLTRPEVKSFAEAFDSRAGKPGAFRAEIEATGRLEWAQSQGRVDLTPEQAIQKTLEKYKNFISADPAQPGAAAPKVVSSPKVAGTIPNVQGRGNASPLKAPVKNLDELRKLSKTARGA